MKKLIKKIFCKVFGISDLDMRSVHWITDALKIYRGWLAVIIAIGIIRSLFSIGFSVLVKIIIDGQQTGSIVLYGVLLLTYAMLCGVFSYLESLFQALIENNSQNRVYSVIVKADWDKTSRFSSGELMSRVNGDAGQISAFIFDAFPTLISSVVQLIVTIIVVASVSPEIVGIVVLGSLLGAFVLGFYKKIVKPRQKAVREAEDDIQSHYSESFSELLVIKSFSREDRMKSTTDSLQDNRIAKVKRRARMSKGMNTILDVMFDAVYFIVFTWAVVNLGKNNITYGTLSMLIALEGYIQGPVMSIVGCLPTFIWALVASDRVDALAHNNISEDDEETVKKAAMLSSPCGVRGEGLVFRYSEGSEPLFSDYGFDIKPGEFVAVTGHSGCGKTTLIRMIMHLLTPESGSIVFYDRNGNTCPGSISTRNRTGYVPQNNTLFTGTIAENICFGVDTSKMSRGEIEEICRRALYLSCADEFVYSLKDGIDTQLGERGLGLSEGQSQRLAVARALASSPAVLILDEATASLDTDTERAILERITSMENRMTIICITHRQAALDFCDRIIQIAKE